MDTAMIGRVLWLRRVLRGRERWSQAQLQDHQQQEQRRRTGDTGGTVQP